MNNPHRAEPLNLLLDNTARYRVVIFDYDSTIAKVPIDWPLARVNYRAYLSELFPALMIDELARVDEMEALALKYAPNGREAVFRFRFNIESALDGGHEAIPEVCEFIQHLGGRQNARLFIISNNLHRTVISGLKQLSLSDSFEAILGVDDVGVPKPETYAFTLLQKSYGLTPSECIFVGDNDRTDGGFCRALGIPFINIKNM